MLQKLQRTEILGFITIVASLLVGAYYQFIIGGLAFKERFAVEDGVIETGTAILLLCIGFYMLVKGIRNQNGRAAWWIICTIAMGVLFVFGGGEEMSWGQRIFGFETPESLKEINRQDEVTLHNIRIGEFDVNKRIFSQLFTAILVIYFLAAPILYHRVNVLKQFINRSGVPIPQWHQTIMFIASVCIIMLFPSEKKWELLEFVFAITMFLVFLYPENKTAIQ